MFIVTGYWLSLEELKEHMHEKADLKEDRPALECVGR